MRLVLRKKGDETTANRNYADRFRYPLNIIIPINSDDDVIFAYLFIFVNLKTKGLAKMCSSCMNDVINLEHYIVPKRMGESMSMGTNVTFHRLKLYAAV